jgi:methyl-accepting chemotaxis protein
LVEEAAAAAESMEEQAQNLSNTVGTFKLAGGGGAVTSRVAARLKPVTMAKPAARPAAKSSGSAQASPKADEWEEF